MTRLLARQSIKMTSTFTYPDVQRDETCVEKIFDVDVADPYRWLEDAESEKTKTFVEQQNAITRPYLDKCVNREKIKSALTSLQDYAKYGCPFKRGQKYYFFKNSGLQAQSVLYQQETLESEPRVFFDPNLLSGDGTIALSLTSFSPDGKYFAYGISKSGSDWVEICVKDVESGEDLSDHLTYAKFTSIEWTHDNKGFFYAKYPSFKGDAKGTATESLQNHSIFYHVLNTPQHEDVLKVDCPDHPDWMIWLELSQDGRYLHIFTTSGCSENAWYYCDLVKFKTNDKLTLEPIYEKMDAKFDYVANNGEIVYFRTNLDAENFRICKFDINKPAKQNWIDVIPNHQLDVLNWAEVYTANGKDYMLVNFTRKVVSELELRELEGKTLKKFDLPPGTIAKTSGRRGDGEFFFQFTSFLTPGQIYHLHMDELNQDAKLIRESRPDNFDPNNFKIEQVFYKSQDGTEVPMFIVCRKDIVLDGSNPCILYGYGGFGHQITSAFNANRIIWMKNFRGILAVANIRGGGELGEKWHDSGRLLNKQSCFNDFISAAEYLIANKYVTRNKLAIEGGSNGGLLVAATSNQRPDIFGATICHVGVLDMIRFSSFTIGHAWIPEYGDPKDKVHFENLIKYSPYHNIPANVDTYPATLLLTADHDDRVVPAHSFKFIAELQHKLGKKLPNTPLLMRVDTKAGHGAGRPTWKVIEEFADIYSFLYNSLQLEQHYTEE